MNNNKTNTALLYGVLTAGMNALTNSDGNIKDSVDVQGIASSMICALKKFDDKAVNWEQRRYEIAKDFMSHIIRELRVEDDRREAAKRAVQCADALIDVLKKS